MTKTIKQFDKSNLQALRVKMDNALKTLEKKFGITIKAGNASFSNNECTFKVKLNTTGADGTAITKEAMNWDRHRGLYDLSHLSVGDSITIQGSPYILSGFNTRASKAPVNFTDRFGRGYKCSVRMLQEQNSK